VTRVYSDDFVKERRERFFERRREYVREITQPQPIGRTA